MFLNGARGASSGCRLLQLKKLLLLKWKKKILIVYIRPPYTKILAPCTVRIVATWSRITYSFLVISVHKTPAYSKVRDKRGTTDKQATYFPLLKLANTARKEIGVVVGGYRPPRSIPSLLSKKTKIPYHVQYKSFSRKVCGVEFFM